jgi:hypothetical protein
VIFLKSDLIFQQLQVTGDLKPVLVIELNIKNITLRAPLVTIHFAKIKNIEICTKKKYAWINSVPVAFLPSEIPEEFSQISYYLPCSL